MAELNLKQITDKLNSEFASDVRKLVFWYDANAEFQEDIDSIELENAKVLHLEPDNQFYIKYFLEREDTTTNYLVYAPFAKPSIRDNHLADTIRYSKEFFADRASLLTLDLGIDERYKPVIQHYIKFFANKDRTQKFYDLEIENFNRSTIEVALMSVLCKDKTASFEEVLRSILTDDGLQDNKYLAEFEKYDLRSAFWQQADVAFGYNDPKPTLEKLVITMFVTYAAKSIHTDMPQAWKPFISYKSGNIIAFMDNLMNSYLYGTRFDEISEIIYNAINGKNYLEKMEVETLVDCNIFAGVDELLISWIIGRLENEDIGAKLNGISSWNVVFELASNLLMMPVVQEDAELMFQLNYLVTESVLHTIFDLSKNMDISDIRPECYYGLNQIGDDVQKNIFDNILQLHYLANKYYKKLEKYKENCKYKGMINKPIFYKE